MAAFSSSLQMQHNDIPILLLDSYQSIFNNIHGCLEEPNNPFSQIYQSTSCHQTTLNSSTKVSTVSNCETSHLSVTNKTTENSVDGEIDHENEQVSRIVKKRKLRNGYSSKGMREVRRKKQEKVKDDDEKKAMEEDQSGYIFVKARRGQATDRHSLAERVRRSKINEKMKQLQAIVPGCDKVNGKALMLDEIINYVQSLQYQVQLLSTKLAYSMNPMLYDFRMDLDEPFMQYSTTTTNDLTLLDNSVMLAHCPYDLPLGNRQMLLELEEQRQNFIHQSEFCNSSLFSLI